jgi:hypothetical protein
MTKFYTVIKNFDMSQYGETDAKVFKKLENANKFADGLWKEFLEQIPEGKLCQDDSEIDLANEFRQYYGVSENGENFVSIRVVEDHFQDE